MNRISTKYSDQTLPLFADMFDRMSEHIAALDKEFRFIVFNRSYQQEFEQTFGHRVRPGMSIMEALADFPKDLKTALRLLARGLKGESFTKTVSFQGAVPRIFETSFAPLHDKEGNIIGTFFIGRDITRQVQTEQTLEEAEKRFQAIFNNTFQFTGLLNPKGIVLEANQTALDFAGLKPKDVIGKPFWESYWWTISPQTQEKLRRSIEKASQGQFIRYEVEVLNADGKPIPLDFSLKPIRNKAGEIILLVPEGRVITEQVKNRTELEQLFETTFEQAAVGIAHVGEHGQFLRLNQKFCEILGYSHDELMELTFQDLTYPPELNKDLELFKRLKAREIPSYALEKRYVRKDGSLIWINLTRTIVWDDQGNIKLAIAVVEDINDRKKAEADLRKTLYRQKLAAKLGQRALSGNSIKSLIDRTTQLLLHALQIDYVSILKQDRETDELKYLSFHGHGETVSGISVGVPGTTSHAGYTLLMEEPVIVEDFSKEIRFTGAKILEEHGIQSGMSAIINGPVHGKPFGVLAAHCKEKRIYTADEINFLQSIANILAVAINRQETEKRIREFNMELERRVSERTEQLENVNKQKSRILAMVSHDFKTPLAAITRFVEILEHQADHLDPEQAKLVRYIDEGSQQLRSLVTDILDRARIEAGQVKPLKEDIPVQPLVEDLLPPLRVLAEKRSIGITTQIDPDVTTVHADPVLLRQVLVNLISNGIKYNRPEGSVFIRIWQDLPKSQLVFEIEDTGHGIAEDKLESLFTDFYRGSTQLNGIEGTGLGLASARKLVELHDGTINVQTCKDVGSIFYVRLPL